MTWAATAVGVAAASTLGGAYISSEGAKSAAKTSARGADAAAQLQYEANRQLRDDLNPYRLGGENALAQILGNNGQSPYANFQQSPGYQFAVDEGTRGVENYFSKLGMNRSGRALKGIERFRQGTANQEYGNWFNRLYGIAGLGQNAAAQTGAGAINTATTAGGALQNAASARGTGYIDQANAYGNALSGLANIAGQYTQQRSGYNQRMNNAGGDLDFTMNNSGLW